MRRIFLSFFVILSFSVIVTSCSWDPYPGLFSFKGNIGDNSSGGGDDNNTILELKISSTGIINNVFDDKYGMNGDVLDDEFGLFPVLSPPIKIENEPAKTKAYALILKDISLDDFNTHWIAANIKDKNIQEDASRINQGMVQGENSFGLPYYIGMFPPETHTYEITVYALSAELSLTDGFLEEKFFQAMEGLILGEAKLQGTYTPLIP